MSTHPHALIVDDDALFVTVAADLLRSRGITVRTATTGEEARRVARQGGGERRIDLFLVDMMLPDDDGTMLCRDLRSLVPEAAIILVTAHPEGLSLVERGQLFADDFFVKTSELGELVWRVRARAEAARSLADSRQREHVLRGVVRLAEFVSPYNDLPTLTASLAPALLTLPGVGAVRLELANDAPGEPPLTVLEAGKVALLSGGAGVVDVPLRGGTVGRLLLATAPETVIDGEVRDTLGSLLGAAVASARRFQALKDRQLRLERGYVDRHRKLRRVGARLERLSEARDSFLALLSHDLRSPLAVVLGQAQLLEEGLIAPGQHGKLAATVRRQGERMVQMVEDLLDRYRRDDAVRSVSESGDALRMATEMVEHFRPLALARRQSLVVHGEGEAPIEVDMGATREVVANLLENAIRHGPEGTEVRVEVGCYDGQVLLAIHDQGPGFSSRKEEGGSGAKIGLRAAARIVAEAGGSLRTALASEGGAVVTVTFPLALARVATTAVELYAPAGPASDALLERLSRHWEVRMTTDLGGALERMRRNPPAVLVLDDTVSTTVSAWVRQAKTDLELASVPIVVVTDNPREMHDAGVLATVARPVEPQRLVAHVRRALSLVEQAAGAPHAEPVDVLTGLQGGRALVASLDDEVAQARAAARPLPVMLVRVDGLREVNRQHGWLVGDQLLLWLSDFLRGRAGSPTRLARVDAESFALALPALDMDAAATAAADFRDTIARARPRLGVARVDVRVSTLALDLSTLALGDQTLVGAVQGGEV